MLVMMDNDFNSGYYCVWLWEYKVGKFSCVLGGVFKSCNILGLNVLFWENICLDSKLF